MSRLIWRMARRYFFSHRQRSIINIISWISLIGVCVSTMALVVVLSVYNGIGELTQGLFNVFDPELKVEPAVGKSFYVTAEDSVALCAVDGVAGFSAIVEEEAWISFGQQQSIVTLRGVDGRYGAACGLDSAMCEGGYLLGAVQDGLPAHYVVIGSGVYYTLQCNSLSASPIVVRIPKRGSAMGFTLDQAFNTDIAYCAGCFCVQQDVDSRYVVADVDFARGLLDYAPDEATALCVWLDGTRSVQRVKNDVRSVLGSDYRVSDRMDQQPLYYKIYRSERLGVIMILMLIVIISTLSLVASLSLSIIDKRGDIATLRNIGMPFKSVRRIFFYEGVLISLIGVIGGLVLGFVVCFLQQQFGIIKMGDGFLQNAFPVSMRAADFLLTFLLVGVVSVASVWLATRRVSC